MLAVSSSDCVAQHTANILGDQKTDILCMDTDGCQAQFPESELKRIVEPKLIDLFVIPFVDHKQT